MKRYLVHQKGNIRLALDVNLIISKKKKPLMSDSFAYATLSRSKFCQRRVSPVPLREKSEVTLGDTTPD